MSPSELLRELKRWMLENDKHPVDVASQSGASIRTIERFLSGHTNPHPLTLWAIKTLIEKKEE